MVPTMRPMKVAKIIPLGAKYSNLGRLSDVLIFPWATISRTALTAHNSELDRSDSHLPVVQGILLSIRIRSDCRNTHSQ